MYDLRSFSLDDMFRCSAELRAFGTASAPAAAAKGIVSFLFEELRMADEGSRQCALVRLFLSRPVSSLSVEDRNVIATALGEGALPDAACLSLIASRGAQPEWNDPTLSRRHRLIPLASPAALAEMPMVSGLVSQLGVPTALLSSTPRAQRPIPFFNVFYVEEARGSLLVPDQNEFVVTQGIRSVLGFGGVLPSGQVYVVILFATVHVPKWTAELFRTLSPSIGFALLTPGRNGHSAEVQRYAEQILRHHEEVALSRLRELHDTTEALASSLAERNRFMALVENSPDFIAIMSPDGSGRYLNPAGRQMIGLSPTFDITTTHMRDYHAERPSAELEARALETVLREGQWIRDDLLRHWQNGAPIPVSARAFRISDVDTGELLGLGTVVRDISEKRRADEERERLLASAQASREEAQRANRAKDDFLASLGHELRNPLTPILTAVQLMKMRGFESREREIIERQALHLGKLVDDLLDVARIAHGKLKIEKRPIEIAVAVARAVEATHPTFERCRQQLRVEVPGKGLMVDADVDRLAQVISNLLDNASKYSDPDTEVMIRAERAGAKLRLSVRDQGIGIRPEHLQTIFESFVQTEAAAPGLGLGLNIVRSLVELHGGTVSAHSEGHGKGSEVVVELPLMTVAIGKTSARRRRASARRLSDGRKRILLVEDNEDSARTLATALSELGHTVVVANDSRAAIDLARDFKPDVALLDIGLPQMDGWELARHLRSLPNMRDDLRFVAVTGYGQENDRRRSSEAGFAAHLVKPVALDALIDAVR